MDTYKVLRFRHPVRAFNLLLVLLIYFAVVSSIQGHVDFLTDNRRYAVQLELAIDDSI